jgi:hypothetical protein
MSDPSPINFTRGVPADESYPVDGLLEAARAATGRRPALRRCAPGSRSGKASRPSRC